MGLGDDLSRFIPTDFGKKKKKSAGDKHAAERAAPPPAAEKPGAASGASKAAADEGSSGNGRHPEGTQPPAGIPATRHAELKGHKKAVSTVAWDPTGDQLVTGEHGAHMLMWDFPSMDQTFQSFRTVVPFEGQQIHTLKYNRGGTLILCATGDPRAKLLTSEGRAAGESRRGDMYVMDMRRTAGHVSGLTAADWDPRGDRRFVTAGGDATLRFWDAERLQTQERVVLAKTRRRGKVAVTACAYSADGALVAAAQHDGGLSLWPAEGPCLRPAHHVADAHTPLTDTSALAFVPSTSRLVSRGCSTVKLWDMRKMSQPLAVAADLPAAGPEANLAFAPDGRILAGLGSGSAAESAQATIAVLDGCTLAKQQPITLPLPGDVLSLAWQPDIDQIAAGLSTGAVAILYDPDSSTRGAKLGAAKQAKLQYVGAAGTGPIITPHALPLFREERPPASGKRAREKARRDPVRSHRPDMPVYGHGHGGVIGVNETQHIMKSIMKDTMRDEDPREALLKYAKAAEDDPMFVAPSYKDKPLFDDSGMADEPEMKRRK